MTIEELKNEAINYIAKALKGDQVEAYLVQAAVTIILSK